MLTLDEEFRPRVLYVCGLGAEVATGAPDLPANKIIIATTAAMAKTEGIIIARIAPADNLFPFFFGEFFLR